MKPKPEDETTFVVILGSFNPGIFQPAWFAAQGLIRKSEAEAANIQLVHSEIVSFRTEWFQLQVTHDRFQLSSLEEPRLEELRDLAASTFELLHHTPASKIGLNWKAHFAMPSEKKWHELGHTMAPVEHWKDILVPQVGMREVIMEGQRPDAYRGVVRVKVEPSARTQHGAFININDHFATESSEDGQGCAEVIEILKSEWILSIERSRSIATQILELV